jgi:hypothetical protein
MTKLVSLLAAFAIVCCVAPAHSSPTSQLRIQAIIRAAFPDDQARALCIADRESDGTPHHWSPAAQNGSNTGLFEIDERTWDPARNPRALAVVGRISWSRMHEAAYNAMVARRIYLYERGTRRDGNGWWPWSTRGLCGA